MLCLLGHYVEILIESFKNINKIKWEIDVFNA